MLDRALSRSDASVPIPASPTLAGELALTGRAPTTVGVSESASIALILSISDIGSSASVPSAGGASGGDSSLLSPAYCAAAVPVDNNVAMTATSAIHPYFTTHLHLLIESAPNRGPGIVVDPGVTENAQMRKVLSTLFLLGYR